MFNVPRGTMQTYLSSKSSIESKPGPKPLLGSDLETKLADYAGNCAEMGIGFGKQVSLQYAGKLVKKHNVAIAFLMLLVRLSRHMSLPSSV